MRTRPTAIAATLLLSIMLLANTHAAELPAPLKSMGITSEPVCVVYAITFESLDGTPIKVPKESLIKAIWSNGLVIRTKNDAWGGLWGGAPYEVGQCEQKRLNMFLGALSSLVKSYKKNNFGVGPMWPDETPWITIDIRTGGQRYRIESTYPLIKYLGPAFPFSEEEHKEGLKIWKPLFNLIMAIDAQSAMVLSAK